MERVRTLIAVTITAVFADDIGPGLDARLKGLV
jgi:hypothetical protein